MGGVVAYCLGVKTDEDYLIKTALRNDKCILIDANSAASYESRHMEGALHCDPSDIDEALKKLISKKKLPDVDLEDDTVPIVCYCSYGIDAGKVKAALKKLGYKNVLNGGGYKHVNYIQNLRSSYYTRAPYY